MDSATDTDGRGCFENMPSVTTCIPGKSLFDGRRVHERRILEDLERVL
jgi:hypothetical protein